MNRARMVAILLLTGAWCWTLKPMEANASGQAPDPSGNAHRDAAQKLWIDSRVRALTERFQHCAGPERPPPWSSPTGQVLLLDPPPAPNQPGWGAGFARLWIRELNQRGVSVVEPEILERVTRTLRWTPGQWLDQKLQKQLALCADARILILPEEGDASSPGAALKDVASEENLLRLAGDPALASEARQAAAWAEEVAALVKKRYPLRGRILNPDAGEVIINLGTRHGVQEGMVFNVLSDGVPIDLADGIPDFQYEWLGRIRVTRTATAFSFAQPEARAGLWHKSQKITLAR
ncbi:MAG: hypothetical protein HQM02_09845 [Magnetococcales bacterium]|nr:hypothetical protein [Magnetococcales bacterium]